MKIIYNPHIHSGLCGANIAGALYQAAMGNLGLAALCAVVALLCGYSAKRLSDD